MIHALAHVRHMRETRRMAAKMIQVRNVPAGLHRELVRRAKAADLTLSDYIQRILEREVALPPLEDVVRRIESDRRIELDRPVSEYLREERHEAGRE